MREKGTQEKEFFSDAGHCACSRMETVRGFNNRRSSPDILEFRHIRT